MPCLSKLYAHTKKREKGLFNCYVNLYLYFIKIEDRRDNTV